MTVLLEARQLNRYLGQPPQQVHALCDASLQIESGRTCAIVGHSGSGKSTLLYLLGLLDRADSGQVLIDGEPTDTLDDDARTRLRNRRLGFVFQFHFLLNEFSALENVTLPMFKLGGSDPAECHEKGMALLADVGLADKADRRANQLSGGEQQRVAIARALANDPLLILADEPTGNLDKANADRVFDLLAGTTRRHGNAFVMVSHNQTLARRCDVVLPMQDGELTTQPA